MGPQTQIPAGTRIVVAMSGGVDSSVAALLLKEQGMDVVGLSMRLWSYEKEATHGCCTPEDLYDARRVADFLEIPYFVTDFESIFETKVVSKFVDSYRMGETPNPCVRCNQDVKFNHLLRRSREMGAAFLATGHYARRSFDGQVYHLLRAADAQRDQSYFLFGLSQEELSKTLFPLGEMTKTEVRRRAEEVGMPIFDKPDSQEICFVPDDYASFVEKKLAPSDRRAGPIVDTDGKVVGQHDGIHQFTVGQRRGLSLPTLNRTYVLAVESDGRVVIGTNDELRKRTFHVRELRWVGLAPKEGDEVQVQIRSRFSPAPAVVQSSMDEKLKLEFRDPQRAITPGQAAVLYRAEEVVGGGWIDRVE